MLQKIPLRLVKALTNIAISASAGSGKTYQLTNRFIYLLHLCEKPERIIALTFTRTAAGEFFQKIIEKLCQASEDPTEALKLSKELSIEADSARYQKLLALLIANMHRLNLQTLDSFFFRLVSAFALELGLSGTLQLLNESSEPRVRKAVRDRIVYQQHALDAELTEFWHAFKQATYGVEQRSVERIVAEFIDNLYALYLEAPEAERWGKDANIWPGGCPWQLKQPPDWRQLAERLQNALPDELGKAQRNDFEAAILKIRNYPIDENLNALLERALAAAPDIFSGSASLKVRKELSLGPQLCQALADCLRAIVWHHLHRALENTQGVFRILQAYHENYDRIVRRPGRLAFADLTHLLNPECANSPVTQVDAFDRQLLDFRLDGQIDHWLFDEFQDTSRPQWQVVANLVDEVVQDTSGQRSLFYVGDTKQCLYLWRNSDDRLFHDIQVHYNQFAPLIQTQPLATSWRSAPAILEAVNAVFSDNAVIAESFSPDAAARWQRAWKKHEASPSTKNLSGFSCWIQAGKEEGQDRNARILQLLMDLNPLARSMSVGILVRKNDDATEIADFLRAHSSLPIHTGSAIRPAVDNSAGTALLALLRLAAHPGDTHARGFLRMIDESTHGTPLLQRVSELRRRLLCQSHEAAVRWAVLQIAEHLPKADNRHRERLQQLIEKARAFDTENERDIDGLHDFLQASSSGDCPIEDSIVIETIHKSKGLEYDVVILVNEDKTVRTERRIHARRNDQGEPEWILEPIKKELMQADPQLLGLLKQSESQQGFGNLCTLYVAMTRARRALYMISDFDRVSTGSTVDFLRQRLGREAEEQALFPASKYPVLWSLGRPEWHQHFSTPESPEQTPVDKIPLPDFAPAHPRLRLSRPSQRTESSLPASRYFDSARPASEFGTKVHAAFEQIEWFQNLDALLACSQDESVQELLAKCFENPEIKKLFTAPAGNSEVWRERCFSRVEKDQFINGVFDRVELQKDSSGNIQSARVIDFKTDRIHTSNTIEQATRHHQPQLEAYRNALAHILNIPEDAIQLYLIFTDIPQLVRI